jgi:DNA-3-methyladenine glycosylase II
MKPAYWDEARAALARRDRVLGKLIRRYPDIHLQRRSDPFTTLARAIVGQQISVKAADTIWQRLVVLVAPGPQRRAFPKLAPVAVTAAPLDALRGCGLSQRKAEYLTDLAGHFTSGSLEPRRWKKMDDEALIAALVGVKGIGRWTAEMFLIFHELRPDVLPVDDIGLQRAIGLHYHAGERPTAAAMRELAVAWQPWRSVATWYLWRSLDPVPVEY